MKTGDGITAIEMTEDILNEYSLERKRLCREVAGLKEDIDQLKQRLRKTPSSFFQDTLLPEWGRQLKVAEKRLKEVSAFESTVDVFIFENKELLEKVTFDENVAQCEKAEEEWTI